MSDLRPSFEERDKYLKQLGTHYADGRLDEAEFERRSDAVLRAVTHRDAMLQFDGLPKPNIVPVQGYQPPPGPRYEPQPYVQLPAPVAQQSGSGRRAFLGLGGIGLGVVGLIGWANTSTYDTVDPFPSMADPDFMGEVPLQDVVGGTFNVIGLLEERGLDHVSAFTIKDGIISGSALELRSPGIVSSFEADLASGAWPQVVSVGEGEVANSLPLHELAEAIPQTYDRAWSEFVTDTEPQWGFELQWVNGAPVYRWSAGGSYAVFNAMLELIELKK